jgi:DNA repair exonuclease SbcCD ATPase subunit
MINNIEIKNCKGLNKTLAVGPVTVLQGPNWSGKTRALEAVTLALLGYHPKYGNTPAYTLRMASGDPMQVRLEGPEFSLVHEFSKAGQQLGFPHGWEFPKMLLDFKEFFNLTGKEQVRTVFKCCKIDLSVEKVVKCVTDVRAKNDAEKKISAAAKSFVEEMDPASSEEAEVTAQQFLSAIIEHFESKAKAAKAQVSTMAKTAQGVTEIAGAKEHRALQLIEEDLEEASNRLEAFNRELGGITAHNAAIAKVKREIAQIETDLTTARSFESVEVKEVDVEGANSKFEAANHALKFKSNLHSELLEKTNALYAPHNDLTRDYDSLVGKSEELQTESEQLRKEMESTLKGDHCPTCKDKSETWKKAYKKFHEAEITAMETELKKLKKDIATLAKKIEKSKATLEAYEAETKAALLAKNEANDTYQTAHSAYQSAFSEHQKSQTARANKFSNLSKVPDLEKRLSAKKAELQEPKDETEIKANGQVIRDLCGTLTDEKNQAIATAAQDNARKEAARKREEAEAEQAIYAGALKNVQALQEETIKESITELMGRVNEKTGNILKTPIAYYDGQFGRFEGPKFVDLEKGFSGAERAMAFVALALTLVSDSPLKIILMDEMSSIDEKNKPAFLAAMVELHKQGLLDNFIGTDPNQVPAVEGVKVIEL